jgi:hypothetical protein
MVNTPWGPPQHAKQIADGIVDYTCAGHGGIHLSVTRWEELKKKLPRFVAFAGPQWLEEDCDYLAAVYVWPEYFAAAPALVAVAQKQIPLRKDF